MQELPSSRVRALPLVRPGIDVAPLGPLLAELRSERTDGHRVRAFDAGFHGCAVRGAAPFRRAFQSFLTVRQEKMSGWAKPRSMAH